MLDVLKSLAFLRNTGGVVPGLVSHERKKVENHRSRLFLRFSNPLCRVTVLNTFSIIALG